MKQIFNLRAIHTCIENNIFVKLYLSIDSSSRGNIFGKDAINRSTFVEQNFIFYLFYLFCSSIVINTVIVTAEPLSRNESGRLGALKSDSTHHFIRNAYTKSGSLRFSQFSGCWLILSVYIFMSFDFPFGRLFGIR